jgi:hypothetical protein
MNRTEPHPQVGSRPAALEDQARYIGAFACSNRSFRVNQPHYAVEAQGYHAQLAVILDSTEHMGYVSSENVEFSQSPSLTNIVHRCVIVH